MQNWCKFIVQSPHHKRGHAITLTAASGLAAFYSATAKFVTCSQAFLTVVHGCAGVRTSRFTTHGQTPNYKHSSRPMPASFRTTNAQNGARKSPLSKSALQPAPTADQVLQVTTPLLIPPLNQLATAARAHGENAENAQEGRGLHVLD